MVSVKAWRANGEYIVSDPRIRVVDGAAEVGAASYVKSTNCEDQAPERNERLMLDSERMVWKASRSSGVSSSSPSSVNASLTKGLLDCTARAQARIKLGRVTNWRTVGL